MPRLLRASLLFAAILVAGWRPAFSQTTFASITGLVTDATGSAVPEATVTAVNRETNIRTATKSNEAGNYTIAQLKEGTYSLEVQASGFRQFVAENIVLSARDVRRVDAKLELGSVETRVEVTGGATLIETETARIADIKDALQLKSLPLNTRGLWAFLALSPGVQQQPGSSVVRFAGSRVNQENWSIDGTTFSDGVDNTQTGPLANYIESFQEVKIDLANNSAEFSSMGQVTIISKSGTNEFHGAGFDYYVTPFFRARDPFSPARATGIRHQPGFTIGGPALFPKIYNGKNRTFFFFSYETARGSQLTQLLTPTVPPTPWRQGDFVNSAAIYDPFGGTPFPNNQLPASRINTVSQKIQDRFYPQPNTGDPSTLHSQNYREAATRPYDPSTYWTTRIDHKFSDKDSVFGRYTWQRLYNNTFEGGLPTIGRRYQERNDRAATVSYTHMFTPTMLNEIRWGFGFNNNPVIPPVNGPQLVQDLGLVGLAPDLPNISGLLQISYTGSGIRGISQANYTSPGYRTHTEEVQDHFSWFRGRHNLKFGYDLLRSEFDSYSAPTALFGSLNFSNRFTSGGVSGAGNPYADFLLGIPTRASRAFPPIPVEQNRWAHDFFAVDDFKISPRLTLNIGLRYELHLPWRENSNQLALFDIATGKIVVPDGMSSKVSPIFPKNYVGIEEASAAGFEPRTLVHPNMHNIAPRIGLAYRPWGNSTVFRAGYGIFYNVVPFVYAINFGGLPFVLNEPAYTNPSSNPTVILPRVFPAGGTAGPDTVGLPTAQNPHMRTPYSMQYNFTIEHQRWNTGFRVSYVGTALREGEWAYDYNSPVPNAVPYIDKPRPYPNYPGITYVTNGAGHQYNGLTVEATRQMASGLYFQASWTWARDRYDMDYNWDFDNWMFTSENPFDRHREVAVAPDVPTHRFGLNYIYLLPFGRGRHFLTNASRATNLVVGGWELSGIFATQTGYFLTPFWSGPDPVGIAYTASDAPDVTIRPNLLKNPNLTSGKAVSRWFDTTAFAPPALGQFGSAAKGTIIGPGVNVWHMGLAKEFFLNDQGMRLRWELTATNIFNHPNWGNPGTDMTDPTGFGVITDANGVTSASAGDVPGARQFRMGLRFQF
ncbi:MAG TPA: carboxypeptidase-like regulatory domain-containing protein [Bryobacteraceae bacterium]|nr:carboxypeptidase-like regulatory domain-containing protein [Bryobacteraceae bacterium]